LKSSSSKRKKARHAPPLVIACGGYFKPRLEQTM
jgi:hypothetical protein